MDEGYEEVARQIFDETEQREIEELLEKGDIESAQEYLLCGIDITLENGRMFPEEAKEFYRLLAIPPERACRFRQKHLASPTS